MLKERQGAWSKERETFWGKSEGQRGKGYVVAGRGPEEQNTKETEV
jgi:hypothetical protein